MHESLRAMTFRQRFHRAAGLAADPAPMRITRQRVDQLVHDWLGASGRTEERLTHVVVDADYVPALFAQDAGTFRADQAAGSSNDGFHPRFTNRETLHWTWPMYLAIASEDDKETP